MLCLFWVALLGVAAWTYLRADPQHDILDNPLYIEGCIYLIVGLGLTLAARPFRFPQGPE